MELEQGDIVLCTVDRIVGTIVFVNINEIDKEGKIVLSEIAPGRIRNLRDYVVPKKTIICKVLDVKGDNINLSLRRVKEKEKKELLEQNKLEKSSTSILKTILKEKTPEAIQKIKQKQKVSEFLEQSKEDPKELEDLVGKENAKKIIEILKLQKIKPKILKKDILLHSKNSNGLELIKEILKPSKDIQIKYLGSGKYSLKTENSDLKKADEILSEKIEKIEKYAKKHSIEFRSA